MKKIIQIAAIIVTVFALGTALHLYSQHVKECRAELEVRYNYILRKLCDPEANEACKVDPELQDEWDKWYEDESKSCE